MSALFGSTYLCEAAFSDMNVMTSKYRTRLSDEHLNDSIRVSLSGYTPAHTCMVDSMQCHSSHWLYKRVNALILHMCHKMLVRWWLRWYIYYVGHNKKWTFFFFSWTFVWIFSDILTMWAIIICEKLSFFLDLDVKLRFFICFRYCNFTR